MSTLVETTMPNGEKMVFYKIDGFSIPKDMIDHMMPAKDLDLQLEWMKETEIRDDDVVICAYPKTGTHWSWEIVNMVLRGSAEYHKDTKEAAMLEFCTKDMTSSMTSPRVLNTHFTHNFLPSGIKQRKCKILNVMRNPKDVVVSMYNHVKTQKEAIGGSAIPPFDVFTKVFRGAIGSAQLCSYPWYLKHWEQFRMDNPDYPILDLFYEDLKKDPEAEIKKIAKFLEKEIDETLVKEISDKCNFQKMKEAHVNKVDAVKTKIPGGTSFLYRKGSVGDWKNYLTVAENEEYDKWIESELKDSKIKFTYQL